MKMVQPTDRISYIKIQLSSIKNTEVVIDPDSIRLSKNIINILSQVNFIIPTQLVCLISKNVMK